MSKTLKSQTCLEVQTERPIFFYDALKIVQDKISKGDSGGKRDVNLHSYNLAFRAGPERSFSPTLFKTEKRERKKKEVKESGKPNHLPSDLEASPLGVAVIMAARD